MPNSVKGAAAAAAVPHPASIVCELHGVPLQYRHDPMQPAHECPVCRPKDCAVRTSAEAIYDPIARGI